MYQSARRQLPNVYASLAHYVQAGHGYWFNHSAHVPIRLRGVGRAIGMTLPITTAPQFFVQVKHGRGLPPYPPQATRRHWAVLRSFLQEPLLRGDPDTKLKGGGSFHPRNVPRKKADLFSLISRVVVSLWKDHNTRLNGGNTKP